MALSCPLAAYALLPLVLRSSLGLDEGQVLTSTATRLPKPQALLIPTNKLMPV
jgi:hypothetical protein